MEESEFKPEIIVDFREAFSIKLKLSELGSRVAEKSITPADYVLSENCAVERKTLKDFLRSIYDGRLFEQVERLAKAYEKPILIVEGYTLQGLENVESPKIFWGALARVLAEWGVSVIFTPDERGTALFLYSLAEKLQKESERRVLAKRKPRVYTLREKQLLILQGLPNIGPERAAKLLERFGTLRRVFQASERELLSVEGFGKKIVRQIREILDTKYPGLEEI
ncbi:hypothetical protein DRO47_06075 [Candidatus Bathyarchaeota archaeon]|nr:MAG: hypothetical protein DRO47_06075 [Candidatus Bathyarchaeota archaeon]